MTNSLFVNNTYVFLQLQTELARQALLVIARMGWALLKIVGEALKTNAQLLYYSLTGVRLTAVKVVHIDNQDEPVHVNAYHLRYENSDRGHVGDSEYDLSVSGDTVTVSQEA